MQAAQTDAKVCVGGVDVSLARTAVERFDNGLAGAVQHLKGNMKKGVRGSRGH